MGRDAQIAVSILSTNEISSRVCANLQEVLPLLESAQCLVIAEEALISADRKQFAAWFENQPAWSDFPIVLLTKRGNEFDKRLAFLDRYLIVLERPFLASSLANSVRSALRARARQLEVKSYIEQKDEVGQATEVVDPGVASSRQEYACQCYGDDGRDRAFKRQHRRLRPRILGTGLYRWPTPIRC